MTVTNQPAQRRIRHFLSIAAVLISFGSYAQHASADREMVIYDPLFWKEELSLRTTQSRKIEQINTEFYESIREMHIEKANQNDKQQKLERGLQERSQKIYEALMPKQRRKLEKIIDKTMPVTAP